MLFITTLCQMMGHGLRAYVPMRCASCEAWCRADFCEVCLVRCRQFVGRCACCAIDLAGSDLLDSNLPDGGLGGKICGECLLHPHDLNACITALNYVAPWKDVIRRYKYGNCPTLCRPLADLMKGATKAGAILRACDGVVAIPSDDERIKARGYHHTLLLAKILAPTKVLVDGLYRKKITGAQSELSWQARKKTWIRFFVFQIII